MKKCAVPEINAHLFDYHNITDKAEHGDFISYTCNAGSSVVSGDATRYCKYGEWTGEEPVCSHRCNIQQVKFYVSGVIFNQYDVI